MHGKYGLERSTTYTVLVQPQFVRLQLVMVCLMLTTVGSVAYEWYKCDWMISRFLRLLCEVSPWGKNAYGILNREYLSDKRVSQRTDLCSQQNE